MKTIRMFNQDLLYGTIKQAMTFIFFVITVLVCINGANEYFISLHAYGMTEGVGTFGDYVMYAFRGEHIYEQSSGSKFHIPIYWFAIQFFIALTVGNYPSDDLASYGRMKILKNGSRLRWLFSKIMWVMVHILVCYGIIYLTIYIFCLMKGADVRLSISTDIWYNTVYNLTTVPQKEVLVIGVILPILSTIAVSLFQTMLSIITQPQIGFTFTVCILIMSTYWTKSIFVPNYTMWCRNSLIDPRGLDTFSGIILNVGIIIISTAIMIKYIISCDIINKKTRI